MTRATESVPPAQTPGWYRDRYREDPSRMITDGWLQINSPVEVVDGEFRVAKDSRRAIRPMVLTETQKLLNLWCDMMCRQMHRSISVHVLKARREGTSTYVQARALCKALVVDGYQITTVAHTPNSAETIYDMGREMRRRLPAWFGLVTGKTIPDSKRGLKIVNRLFGVSSSVMRCLPATENIVSAHGSAAHFLHCSEYARYPDPEAFNESVGSIVLPGENTEKWYETTANGQDKLFHPEFMLSWEAQGKNCGWPNGKGAGVNFFEPAALARIEDFARTPSLAFFVPWYRNETSKIIEEKHLPLKPAYFYDAMLRELEDYERTLLHNHLMPMWTSPRPFGRGIAESAARERSLRQLYWRRCKLAPLYKHSGIQLTDPGSKAVGSLITFQRMEPADVKEAFSSSDNDPIFESSMIDWMASTVADPTVRGRMEAGALVEDYSLNVAPTEGSYPFPLRVGFSIWGDLAKTSGDLWVCVDFAEGLSIVTDVVDWGRDFHHMVMFDRETGEQVAEYISQKRADVAAKEIIGFLRWVAKRTKGHFLPFLTYEAAKCKPFEAEIEDGYDIDRVYVRRVDENSTTQEFSRKMGVYPSPTVKKARVQLVQEAIGLRRWIVRSDVIARQAHFFVETKLGEAQAIAKDQGGERSKDDGVIAVATLCFTEASIGEAYEGPRLLAESEVPEELHAPDHDMGRFDVNHLERTMCQAAFMGKPMEDLPRRDGSHRTNQHEVMI